MYYEKEWGVIEEHCSMKTSQMAWKIKSEVLNKYMKDEKLILNIKEKDISYALLHKDKSIYFSNLKYPMDFNLDKPAHNFIDKSIHVLKMSEKNIPISYIVVEDVSGYTAVQSLRVKIVAFIVLNCFGILIFGYILSKILLRPIRENFAQLNNFVKNSSHELNTPITALVMINSKIKNENLLDKKTQNQIATSVKNIKLSSDKLLFSVNGKTSERYDEEFDFKDLIQESVSFFDELAHNKNINLTTKLSKCLVVMDKYCASMLINNLLSNAIKYTPKDKSIHIYLQNNRFFVSDEGVGIEENMQKEIFQRYKRGTSLEGGFGIGLDIISSICKEYNIDIVLKSKKDKGSKFSFDLSSIKKDKKG